MVYRRCTHMATVGVKGLNAAAVNKLVLMWRRSTTNLNKRIELLESSVYKSLKADVKAKMIRQPYAGLVSHSDNVANSSFVFC